MNIALKLDYYGKLDIALSIDIKNKEMKSVLQLRTKLPVNVDKNQMANCNAGAKTQLKKNRKKLMTNSLVRNKQLTFSSVQTLGAIEVNASINTGSKSSLIS